MPIPFAPFFGLIAGILCALLGHDELRRHDGHAVTSRPFLLACAFSAMVFMPAVAYFVAFHGDWAYLYLFPWKRVPSALDLVIVLGSGATVPAGFVLAATLQEVQGRRAVLPLALLPALLLGSAATLLRHRLFVSATYAQFRGGFGAEPALTSTLGRSLFFMLVVLSFGFAYCLYSVRHPPR